MRARHNLAWLTAQGWTEAKESVAPALHVMLDEWMQADRPAVVRRLDADAGEDEWSLGIALPPAVDGGAKQRIGLRVRNRCIAKAGPPLLLAQAIPSAPVAWRNALADLVHGAAATRLKLHVYGSLALQTLTGLDYVRPSSDIDLLIYPSNPEQLLAGAALLRNAGAALPLDGEIVFPGGEAVAWKEWQAAVEGKKGTRVLLKHLRGVRLADPAELLAALEARQWVP